MARYDRVYANLAERAVLQGGIDAEAFIRQALDAGISPARLVELIQDDMLEDGPVFGKFLRSIVGAVEASAMAAQGQGVTVGTIDGDDELRRLVGLANTEDVLGDGSGSIIDSALSGADPELAQQLEDAVADHLIEVSIAELKNTCHICLPLHGQKRTRAEWRDAGLLPEMRHEGWSSSCHCRLVPMTQADGRADLMAPLRRVGAGLKGSKRTVRAVTQQDMDRAIAARDAAMDTEEGRRVLRRLGMALEDAIHGG